MLTKLPVPYDFCASVPISCLLTVGSTPVQHSVLIVSSINRFAALLLITVIHRCSASCCRSWCRGRSTPRTWRCWWAWRRPARRCRTGCWSWWARWAGIGGAGSRDRIVSCHWSGHRAPGHHRGPARDQRQDEQRDGAVPALPGQVCQQDSQERPGGEYYYYYL